MSLIPGPIARLLPMFTAVQANTLYANFFERVLRALITIGTLGSELLTNGTFTGSAAGWTSTGWTYSSNKITHNTGNTSPLSQAIQIEAGTHYLISYQYSGNTAGTFTTSINGTDCPNFNTIEVGVVGTYTAAYYSSGASGSLTFAITPSTDFDGSFDNLSVKAVAVSNSSLFSLTDIDGETLFSIRGDNSQGNLGIGGGSTLELNVTGTGNLAIGKRALNSNISGSENTAVGLSALDANTVGFANTAVGWNALASNISGFQNCAFGHNALASNTTGAYNMAVGQSAMSSNTSGISNVAVGINTLENNTTGTYNIAFGSNALSGNTTGTSNLALGIDSSTHITTGESNNALGTFALQQNITGDANIAHGVQSLQVALGNGNAALGVGAGSSLIHGESNIFIGYGAGNNQTGGSNNLIVGDTASVPDLTGSNQVNILNTWRADSSFPLTGIGIGNVAPTAILELRASNGAANHGPFKLRPGTLVSSPENGLMEYDGTNLYFTIGGVRKIVTLT